MGRNWPKSHQSMNEEPFSIKNRAAAALCCGDSPQSGTMQSEVLSRCSHDWLMVTI